MGVSYTSCCKVYLDVFGVFAAPVRAMGAMMFDRLSPSLQKKEPYSMEIAAFFEETITAQLQALS